MKRGIVITTSEFTKDFLKPLLDSIKDTKYDILVVSNGGYKPNLVRCYCGRIVEGVSDHSRVHCGECDYSSYSELNPLEDKKSDISLVINKHNEWELGGIKHGKETFDEFVHLMDTTLIKDVTLFDKLFEIEGNVVLTKGNYHYMGKFVSDLLPELPTTLTKEHAIHIEMSWLPKPYTEFTPDLPVHTEVFEEIHGQHRMKLENKYMIKWKGTYRI